MPMQVRASVVTVQIPADLIFIGSDCAEALHLRNGCCATPVYDNSIDCDGDVIESCDGSYTVGEVPGDSDSDSDSFLSTTPVTHYSRRQIFFPPGSKLSRECRVFESDPCSDCP